MPESALTAPKEKKLSGRQWFESGRAAAVCHFFLTLSPPHIVDALNLYCPLPPSLTLWMEFMFFTICSQ